MGDQEGGIRESWFLAIGGGEEKEDNRSTLRRFLGLAGGSGARVLVIELGEERTRGPIIKDQLVEVGAASVTYLHANDASAFDDADALAAAENATGFYLVGGSPAHADLLLASRIGKLIAEKAAAGCAIAASGAACALLGEFQIVSNQKKSASPVKGFVSLRAGLGFLPGIVFDGPPNPSRYVRLLTAVAQSPFHLGIAVDEGTLALFGPDGVVEAYGAGSVSVVDGSSAGYSNYFALKEDGTVGLTGARVSLLTDGMRFDLVQRAYIYPHNERTHKRVSAQAEARALTR
ncbi:MAG: cyanophycinase [bacterium]